MHEEPLPNMCSRWVDGSGCVWGPAFITERLWQPFAIDPLRFNVRIPIILLKVQKEAERRWMRLSDSREKIIRIIRSSLAFKRRHLQTFFFVYSWVWIPKKEFSSCSCADVTFILIFNVCLRPPCCHNPVLSNINISLPAVSIQELLADPAELSTLHCMFYLKIVLHSLSLMLM